MGGLSGRVGAGLVGAASGRGLAGAVSACGSSAATGLAAVARDADDRDDGVRTARDGALDRAGGVGAGDPAAARGAASTGGGAVCSTVAGAEGGAGATAGAIGAAAAGGAGGEGAGTSRTPSTVISSARWEVDSPPTAHRHATNAAMARPALASTTRTLEPAGLAANPKFSLPTTNCLGVITPFRTPVRARVQAPPANAYRSIIGDLCNLRNKLMFARSGRE